MGFKAQIIANDISTISSRVVNTDHMVSVGKIPNYRSNYATITQWKYFHWGQVIIQLPNGSYSRWGQVYGLRVGGV